MYLDSLLKEIEYTCLQGEAHTLVTDLVYDSRKANKEIGRAHV